MDPLLQLSVAELCFKALYCPQFLKKDQINSDFSTPSLHSLNEPLISHFRSTVSVLQSVVRVCLHCKSAVGFYSSSLIGLLWCHLTTLHVILLYIALQRDGGDSFSALRRKYRDNRCFITQHLREVVTPVAHECTSRL